MAVNIVTLSWPEYEHGEEVRARDECDSEGHEEDPWLPRGLAWKPRIFRGFELVDAEGDDHHDTDGEGRDSMRGAPFVLVTTPLKPHHEK